MIPALKSSTIFRKDLYNLRNFIAVHLTLKPYSFYND